MTKSTSKMEKRWDYYYKYICIWNNETKTKSQVPIKLAHVDQYELALDRKDIVENFETAKEEIVESIKIEFLNEFGVWNALMDPSTLSFQFNSPEILFKKF